MAQRIKLLDQLPQQIPVGKAIGGLVGLILLITLLTTSVYSVPVEAEGVVLRFGRFTKTVDAGLHYKLPFGMETVVIVPVKLLQQYTMPPDNLR